MAYDIRKCLWFGTLEWMQWVKTPLQGAESSPESWQADGTLLSGGGYSLGSWGSHKVYTYEWPESSSPEMAQLMKSYASGTYGRGLIYFVDPLIYTKNVLPERISDPSMAVDDEGASMVYGVYPEGQTTSGFSTNALPIRGANYDLGSTVAGFRGMEDATFIPIPQGYSLWIGAVYERTGSGGIFLSPQNTNGTIGTAKRLTERDVADTVLMSDMAVGIPGVWLWLGKSSSGASTVTAQGLIARLVPVEWLTGATYTTGIYLEGEYGTPTDSRLTNLRTGPWMGGMGHSGARFVGKPTMTSNSPIDGGRMSYAVSFREVGSWVYG